MSNKDPFSERTKMTMDHVIIKKWVEERGGEPASVPFGTPDEEEGVLRIRFKGTDEFERFKPISWSEFFTKFDQSHLAFMYEEDMPDGKISKFFKFISMDGE
jgi:hypothetical protein